MSIYLTKVTEQYRIDTEQEVDNFLNEQKQEKTFEVVKSSSEKKVVKAKGEIIDEFYRVTIVKEFQSEKEPADAGIKAIYDYE